MSSAGPLDLDFYIGLPPHVGRDRVAYLRTPTKAMAMRDLRRQLRRIREVGKLQRR